MIYPTTRTDWLKPWIDRSDKDGQRFPYSDAPVKEMTNALNRQKKTDAMLLF